MRQAHVSGDAGLHVCGGQKHVFLGGQLAVWLDVLQDPHTDEGCCAYTALLCLSTHFRKRLGVKTDRQAFGEIFCDTDADGLELVLEVGSVVGIPKMRLLLIRGKVWNARFRFVGGSAIHGVVSLVYA